MSAREERRSFIYAFIYDTGDNLTAGMHLVQGPPTHVSTVHFGWLSTQTSARMYQATRMKTRHNKFMGFLMHICANRAAAAV